MSFGSFYFLHMSFFFNVCWNVHVIQGEFWLHCWVFGTTTIVWVSCHWEKNKIVKKNSIKKFIYHKHIQASSKNLELWADGSDGPLSCPALISPRKVIVEKRIILNNHGKWWQLLNCHNLSEFASGHLQEVGLMHILADYVTLIILCHVGLHVDFTFMKFSLGP